MLFPAFSLETEQILDNLSELAGGGVLLLSPAGDIALVRGEPTVDAERTALANVARGRSSVEEASSFECGDGSLMYLLAVTEGWVLCAHVRKRREMPDLSGLDDRRRKLLEGRYKRASGMRVRILMHRAREHLRRCIEITPFFPGGRGSGESGAPAEVLVAVPRNRLN